MYRSAFRIVGLLGVAVAATAGHANATPLTYSQIFTQFNAVIFNNFSANSEVEGRTVVGGNVTAGSNFEIHSGLAASSYGALNVYGSVTDTGTINVNNGGAVAIAGNNSASYNMNGGGSGYVGGNNSGTFSVNGGTANLSVIGTNAGNLSLSSGGTVYVGQVNSGSITVNGSPATIAINGNTSGNISLNSGNALSVKGSNTGSITLNGGSYTYTGSAGSVSNINGGSVTKANTLNLTAPTSTLGNFATTFQTPLTALSTQLAGVASNSVATSANGAVTFNAAPNTSGTAVFNVNSSLFNGASTVSINLDGATSVIINVDVDNCANNICTFAPTSNFQNPTGYASTVLWNFVNATNIDFSTEFGGSVLAPDATVNNSNSIDGTLVAENDTGSNGELHEYGYTGQFPGGAVPAPEPASLAVIGTGLVGIAFIRRRR